jgi:hypothetical protein
MDGKEKDPHEEDQTENRDFPGVARFGPSQSADAAAEKIVRKPLGHWLLSVFGLLLRRRKVPAPATCSTALFKAFRDVGSEGILESAASTNRSYRETQDSTRFREKRAVGKGLPPFKKEKRTAPALGSAENNGLSILDDLHLSIIVGTEKR